MPTKVGRPTEVGAPTEPVGRPPEAVGRPTAGEGLVPAASLNAAITATVRELARSASVEVLPRQIATIDPNDYLPSGTAVYVPYPPGGLWQDTVAACRRLGAARMCPVPHLTARSVRDPGDLRTRLTQLAEAGVDRLLLVAGDADRAAGRYRDTRDVLESGLLAEYGFDRLGVAAHPEGHPLVEPADLERALARKVEYAAQQGASMWIVTQFGFSPAATAAWLLALRAAGFPLEVRVGMAGPARLSNLLGFAAKCGVRTTARIVARRPGTVRLFGRYAPDELVEGMARHAVETADSPLAGIHLFGFGGIRETSRWLRAVSSERERIGEPADGAPRGVGDAPAHQLLGERHGS